MNSPRERARTYIKNFTQLETPRLIFRPLRAEDDAPLFDAIKNPRVYGWNSTFPNPLDMAGLRHWLGLRIDGFEAGNELYMAGLHKDSGVMMGYISIRPDKDDDSIVEIGGCLNELYWGKGLPEEILLPVIGMLFNDFGFSVIRGRATVKNVSSMRLLEMMNFKFMEEGEVTFSNGNKPLLRTYHLSLNDWLARKFVGVDEATFTPAQVSERRRQLIALCQGLTDRHRTGE